MAPLLQQSEDQFAYEVVSRVLDRSADGNHIIDTLFFALMAAQAAIYAIIFDKVKEYPALDWELLLGGFIVAIGGTALTLFVREAPHVRSFAADFPKDPEGTRRQYIDDYVIKVRQNERIRMVKTIILGISLSMTVVPLVIATVWRVRGL